jgi:hypothetical protein
VNLETVDLDLERRASANLPVHLGIRNGLTD